MSQRKQAHARCPRCLMRIEHCFCADIPQISLKTEILIISRAREIKAPSNTARLAALALPNSKVLIRGSTEHPYDLKAHLDPHRRQFLLYPDPEAPTLQDFDPQIWREGAQLIVPDGNWRQTSKLARRDPDLAMIPKVSLAPESVSAYKIRAERKAEGLATLEAIARALGVMEGLEVRQQLEELLARLVEGTLKARGQHTSE